MLDASVAVKLVLREEDSALAFRMLETAHPCAPDFVVLEVSSALWRHARNPMLRAADLPALVGALAEDLDLIPTPPLVPAALDLALLTGATVYDCVYLALALRDGATLITADARFVQAVKPHHPDAIVLLRDA